MTKWLLAILFGISSWVPVCAQDLDVVKVDVSLVTVNISVTDRKGRPIRGLEAQDFRLTDEGKSVPLEFFESEGPVSIVFVVDLSSSMRSKWDDLKKAMKKFLANAPEGSDYTLITFANRPQVIACSVNADELWKNLAGLKPYGETALYDGMLSGLHALRRAPQRHKALLLLSDGEDNSSQSSLAEVQATARAQRSTVYTVGLLEQHDLAPWQQEGKKLLVELATATGGLVLFPEPHEIRGALEKINTDVKDHYSLGYYPPDKVPGWRRVQVNIDQVQARFNLRYQDQYLMR